MEGSGNSFSKVRELNWLAKKITREDAVNDIVRRYLEFVEIFEEQARAA